MHAIPIDPDALLREVAGVHRLARAIVRDPQLADDIAQDTVVMALRRPPRGATDPVRLRSWLAAVVRSLALRAWRSARTRAYHEERAAPPEADDAEAAAAARLAQHRELLAAVASLAEPYRTAITLRFLEGRSPRAIARALGVDAAAVRQRVHRGVAMLRARLERRHGDARFAVAALLPPASWLPWLPSLLPGASIMVSKQAVVAMAAVVGAAALFVPWAMAPGTGAADAPAARSEAVPARAEFSSAAAPAVRESVQLPVAVVPAADEVASTGTLVVRVRAAGEPLVGAPVSVWNRGRATRTAEPEGAQMVTDGGGEVRFAALAPGSWTFTVDGRTAPKAESSWIELHAGETVEREVDLRTGFTLVGTVVDERGTGVPGARIVADLGFANSVLARSGPGGAFRATNLVAPLTLRARAAGVQPSESVPVAGEHGATVQVELRLLGVARRVDGRVWNTDGTPSARARVVLVPIEERTKRRWESSSRIEWGRTDAEGVFRFDDAGAGVHVVVAQPADESGAPAWAEVDTTRGDAAVEVRMAGAGVLRGRVRGDEQPLAGVDLVAWPDGAAARAAAVLEDVGWRHGRTGSDGTFELRGLAAGPVRVRAIANGAVAREAVLELAAGGAAEWLVDLPPVSELEVAVRGAASKYLMAMVRPAAAPADGLAGPVPLRDGEGKWRGARAASVDVYLLFVDDKQDMVQLACQRDVTATQRAVQFELAPAQLPAGALCGRLVDGSRAPLAGRRLEVRRVDGAGLVVRRGAVSGADGRFRTGPLPPGEYELVDVGGSEPRVLARRFAGGAGDEDLGDVAPGG